MKERPILFSSDMVNAILHGTANTKAKTQTRRIVKPQLKDSLKFIQLCFRRSYYEYTHAYLENEQGEFRLIKLRYGAPEDRLWVRETFCVDEHREDPQAPRYLYRADYAKDVDRSRIGVTKWKPALHMPREASRITLEIRNIRIERLQDITEADAVAEGVVARNYSAVQGFMELWDSILGEDAHRLNPFVWVIEFKRLEAV